MLTLLFCWGRRRPLGNLWADRDGRRHNLVSYKVDFSLWRLLNQSQSGFHLLTYVVMSTLVDFSDMTAHSAWPFSQLSEPGGAPVRRSDNALLRACSAVHK